MRFHLPDIPSLTKALALKGAELSGLQDQYNNIRHPIRHAFGGPSLEEALAGDPGISSGVMVGPFFRGATVGRRFEPHMGTPEWPVQGVHFSGRELARKMFAPRGAIKQKTLHKRTLDLRKTGDWYDQVDPAVAKRVRGQIINLTNTKKLTKEQKQDLMNIARLVDEKSKKLNGPEYSYDELRGHLTDAIGIARPRERVSGWYYDKDSPLMRELGQKLRSAFVKSGYDSMTYWEPSRVSENRAIAVLKRPKRTIDNPSRRSKRGEKPISRQDFYSALRDPYSRRGKMNSTNIKGLESEHVVALKKAVADYINKGRK